jgi:hypothetical protein
LKSQEATAKAEQLAATASRSAQGDSTDGRLMGWLSIGASPLAVLVSPTIFSVAGFFLAMIGLTLAAPSQRIWSIVGIVTAVAGGAIGYYFKTPIV